MTFIFSFVQIKIPVWMISPSLDPYKKNVLFNPIQQTLHWILLFLAAQVRARDKKRCKNDPSALCMCIRVYV